MNEIFNIDDLFPSRYIKSSDIGEDDLAVTMDELRLDKFHQNDNLVEKPVLLFKELEKGLVLNKQIALR